MPAKDSDRWGRWSSTVDELVTYRYLGCRSEAIDPDHATGHMRLRSDMHWSAGLLGTPLAVAMLDTAGINIDGIRFAALTHVALQIHSSGDGVTELRIDGEVARLARTMIFTEAVLRDSSESANIVATGTADWSSQGEVGPEWSYIDPGPGVPDVPPMPPLIEAFHIEPLPEGGYVIPSLRPAIGDQLLHHGPQMAALEWHSNDAAAALASIGQMRLQTFDVRLLRGGARAPFVTRAREHGRIGDIVVVNTELVDGGGRGNAIARSVLTYRVIDAVTRSSSSTS